MAISWSQIRQWLTCPERYRRVYIVGERTRPSEALLIGRLTHTTLATMWEIYGASGQWTEDMAIPRLEAICDDVLPDLDSWGITYRPREELVRLAIELARVIEREAAPEIDWSRAIGIEVERKIEATIEGVDFIGYIDLVSHDVTHKGKDSSSVIWEWKTASRKPPEEREVPPQVGIYAALWEAARGSRPARVVRITAVESKGGPKAVREGWVVAPHHVEFARRMIRDTTTAIHAGLFPPNPTGWWCSPTACEFFESCRGGY